MGWRDKTTGEQTEIGQHDSRHVAENTRKLLVLYNHFPFVYILLGSFEGDSIFVVLFTYEGVQLQAQLEKKYI